MIKDFFRLFYPKCCVSCETALLKNEFTLCLSCKVAFDKLKKEVDETKIVQKFTCDLQLSEIYTLTHYPDSIKNLLKEFKYYSNKEIGEFYADQVFEKLQEKGVDLSELVIIPIPMHYYKKWERGFNQTDYIAEILFRKYKITYSTKVLKRISLGEKFAGSSRLKRISSVSQYYDVCLIPEFQHKKLLILDDVITTGSTMEECVKMLRESGYSKIGIFSLICV